MSNPGGISIKKVLTKSGISLLVLSGLFLLLIFLFGDKASFDTEIRRIPSLSVSEVGVEKPASPAQSNLTESISSLLAERLLEKNPTGPQQGEGSEEFNQILALNPEEFVSQSIEEALVSADIEIYRPEIEESDLTVIDDESIEAQRKYLEGLNAIYQKNFEGVSISQANIQSGGLSGPVNAFAKSKEDLLALEVPRALLSFHLRSLELVVYQENLLRLVANYQEDPLLAYLAFEKLSELIEEAHELNQDIDTYFKKLG